MTPSAELLIHTRCRHTSASQNLLPDVSGKQIIPRFVSVCSVKAGPKQQERGPEKRKTYREQKETSPKQTTNIIKLSKHIPVVKEEGVIRMETG